MKTKRFRTSEKRAGAVSARSYETKLDQKKRVVLRGALHKYYEVREEANGSYHLTPKKLVDIEPISERSLAMLDSSIANFKKSIASEPIDLTALKRKYARSSRSRVLPAKRVQNIHRPATKEK